MASVVRKLVGREGEVAVAYRAGKTVEALAEQYGVSLSTVCRALDRAGQPRRQQGRRETGVPGREAEIVAAYNAGATIAEIAQRFGCSTMPIREALVRAGVERRGPGRVRAVAGQEAAIAAAYEAGATTAELAALHNVSHRLIARICQEEGVIMRPPGRRMKLDLPTSRDRSN
jgi:uncharacterized protein (DUF433 family)